MRSIIAVIAIAAIIAAQVACYVGGLALLCWLVVTILRHLGVHI
jgi:hypothetical protein